MMPRESWPASYLSHLYRWSLVITGIHTVPLRFWRGPPRAHAMQQKKMMFHTAAAVRPFLLTDDFNGGMNPGEHRVEVQVMRAL